MRFFGAMSWVLGLFAAAGVEAALGGGAPGPLLLVALAAGLWSGPATGALVGALAGLAEAAITGGNPLVMLVITSSCAAIVSLLRYRVAREHILIAMAAGAVISCAFVIFTGISDGPFFRTIVPFALLRGLGNALWMIPIYGIVFIIASRMKLFAQQGE